MTQQQEDTVIKTVLEIINSNRLEGLGKAVSIFINEAMKEERPAVLNTLPWERTENRMGYGSGFKDRSMATSLGEIRLKVPQVRGGVEFHPSALDKGIRSATRQRYWMKSLINGE